MVDNEEERKTVKLTPMSNELESSASYPASVPKCKGKPVG